MDCRRAQPVGIASSKPTITRGKEQQNEMQDYQKNQRAGQFDGTPRLAPTKRNPSSRPHVGERRTLQRGAEALAASRI